ncbi:S-protein homolog 8 [Linum grandiflorum]
MTSNIPSLAIVVATTLLLLATTIPPSSAEWFRPHFHVHIINELSQNEVLTVQCNCTDRPQPTTYVQVGSEYELVFRLHVWRDTRWTCYVSPDGNRHVTFAAYSTGYVDDYDHRFYWPVKEDGVYQRFPGNPDLLAHQWE